jgi:hypothetical protein
VVGSQWFYTTLSINPIAPPHNKPSKQKKIEVLETTPAQTVTSRLPRLPRLRRDFSWDDRRDDRRDIRRDRRQ